jgi:hypothetical protein
MGTPALGNGFELSEGVDMADPTVGKIASVEVRDGGEIDISNVDGDVAFDGVSAEEVRGLIGQLDWAATAAENAPA